MELIIDIDEDYYELIKHDVKNGMDYLPCKMIANGTPLPKGHGRLIDESDLIPDSDYEDGIFYAVSIGQINGATTIIKADKEQEDNGFFDEIMDDESEDEETYEKIKEIIDKVKEQEE